MARDEKARRWESKPVQSGPIHCMLCPNGVDFLCREGWLRHLDDTHGGRQRYRDACLSLAQLAPQVVSGQEWRSIVANFAEFYTRSATDWEKFTPCMQMACSAGEPIPPEIRWEPRQLIGCFLRLFALVRRSSRSLSRRRAIFRASPEPGVEDVVGGAV